MLLDMRVSRKGRGAGTKRERQRERESEREKEASYKRLYSKFKCSRDNNFPTDAGMGPVIWFLRRSSEINEPLQTPELICIPRDMGCAAPRRESNDRVIHPSCCMHT